MRIWQRWDRAAAGTLLSVLMVWMMFFGGRLQVAPVDEWSREAVAVLSASGDQPAWLERSLADQPSERAQAWRAALVSGDLQMSLLPDPSLAGGKPVVVVGLSLPPDHAWVGVYGWPDREGAGKPEDAKLLGAVDNLSAIQSIERVEASEHGPELHIVDLYDERVGASLLITQQLLLKWDANAGRFSEVWRGTTESEQYSLKPAAQQRLLIHCDVAMGGGRVVLNRHYELSKLERGQYVPTLEVSRREVYEWDPGRFRFVGGPQELPPELGNLNG